jgi:DNA-K related protein/Hsp70 protein
MEGSTRYLIGIDLGTTNTVVAYVDTREVGNNGSLGIRVFPVAQLVGPGEVRDFPALPSFLYFPTEDEISTEELSLPWEKHPSSPTGRLARERGALTPGRQVSSAKSWLCQRQTDRTAKILPPGAEQHEPMVSPVEASARYLVHLRNAWNSVMTADVAGSPEQLFEKQQIVLTVPASFDEEARELTVEAAHQAGLENLTLLEEPLAAFYAWIAEHQHGLREQVRDGDLVLICDIGGGTTDFSLVRVHISDVDVQFERTAIGEHLLLGGDNLDLALARRVEQKLHPARISSRQRHALGRACCAAKERLLNDPNVDRLPINILGTGRSVVGQMLTSELTREEVLELLMQGFLPLSARDEFPARDRVTGLRELGLSYASDPAITKHLAAFLTQAALAMNPDQTLPSPVNHHPRMARPDAILFNGGFCTPVQARERVVQAIASWFDDTNRDWRPKLLNNESMDGAVAVGAAYYGRVRHGSGLRIKAGSARTYYIGMRSEQGLKAVCVLPSGTEEGTTLRLSQREFSVLANRPVSFILYSSRVRHDQHGEIADLDPAQVQRHAPLVTLLRYGKKLLQMELAVRLTVSFTEVGTLELWCESQNSPHRWRLQFALRGDAYAAEGMEPETQRAAPTTQLSSANLSGQGLESGVRRIQRTFTSHADGKGEPPDPATLVSELESVIGLKRDSWPITLLRRFSDVLLEVAAGRTLSPRHEARWLNLFGYCLRPGFGDQQDSLRTTQARKIYQGGPIFLRDAQCPVDWLVLWRRISPGLSAGHQHELRNHLTGMGIGRAKTGGRLHTQLEHEGWRLLASLEHLSGPTRAALGNELLRKLKKEPTDSGWLWSIGRLGERIPLYGSLNCVVAPETAADWIQALLDLRELTSETASAIVQVGRFTNDRSRDISDDVRNAAITKLRASPVADEAILQRLARFVNPDRSDVVRTFGEPLPKGMQLESTANCLSPIRALTSGL